MASLPVRDPVGDHLLTPQNAALVVIDYQPSQFTGVRSTDRDLLLENIVSTVKTATAFDLPIVHSTINVATGRGQPTVPELAEVLEHNPPIDRTTTNAWEDADFLAAVRATGRRKLILCALWTEICMAFPALDALREGYDVYPSSTRSAEPAMRPTAPASSASSGPARNRSPGSLSPSSSNATGPAKRRSPTSSRSSSTNACSRHETSCVNLERLRVPRASLAVRGRRRQYG
jgi:hypothetical protein